MTSVFSGLTSNSLPHSRLNFHGDELHPLGGAELGGELRAEAVSHLEEVSLGCPLSINHFPPLDQRGGDEGDG